MTVPKSRPTGPVPAGRGVPRVPREPRFRQIHLDFHTSEHIVSVGSAFDPEAFADTLARAHVDSVTCFARCHHGWMYYASSAFPERRHPQLQRDLLREQIAACHARGIRVPIYTSVQWDLVTATEHPEWRVLDDKGAPRGIPLYEPGFQRPLCLNSPYRAYLCQHLAEVLGTLPVDGLFFDIVLEQDCSCHWCREAMEAEGLDPAEAEVRQRFARRSVRAWEEEAAAQVRAAQPEATVFFNSGHVGPSHREIAGLFSHFELESLPSGGWGYLHFPVTARYVRTLGRDYVGMTGKFHTSWGDFHSYKNEAALQFECFQMLALGARCSIGDQLHPSGRLEPDVYALVGSVYAEVERCEPWCRGARPLADIGVFSPEAFGVPGRVSAPAKGVTRMLEETAHQFDMIDGDPAVDLGRYRVLILPDRIPLSRELAVRLEAYLESGGALLASYRSGLEVGAERFATEVFGVRLLGEAPFSPDYLRPRAALAADLPATEHVMYQRGLQVEPLADSEVLADVVLPYFDRTYRHFSSHRQTPSSGQPGYPAIVRRGRAVYFAHPVFSQYSENAPRWCRRLVEAALRLLLPDPLLRHDGPSTLRATTLSQEEQGRLIVHLLHYIPERRGDKFDVIEDVIPLHEVRLSLRSPAAGARVTLVPQGRPLPATVRDGRLWFQVPAVQGHQLVEIVPQT